VSRGDVDDVAAHLTHEIEAAGDHDEVVIA
jgi:hypothetical protein